MRSGALAILAALLIAGCGVRKTNQTFTELEKEFIYTALAFSPVSATSAGYHRHESINLDEQLDDFSPASLDQQKKFYDSMRYRLRDATEPGDFSPEDRADRDIIGNQIELALLDLNDIQSYRHNPTIYVELIGNALFNPLV